MENWPNFFIVGAPRAGTTTMYYYLSQIPQIYMSSRKEPHYFAPHLCVKLDKPPIRDRIKYLELFQGVTNEIAIGEASTHYLQDPEAPTLIHQVVPHARIIIILRDPVERAFSDYLMYMHKRVLKSPSNKKLGMKLDSLEKPIWIQVILDAGFYSEQIKRYLKIFGNDQVKIFIFEEFIRNATETIKEVLKFLGVNSQIDHLKEDIQNPFEVARLPFVYSILANKIIIKIAQMVIPHSGRQYLRENILIKKVPKPPMLEEDRTYLQNIYRNDVKKICDILGRSLPWPNFQKV